MLKIPNEVLDLKKKLNKIKIWYNITNNDQNQPAFGCVDASNKRVRLGHSKIPIFCELKSCFGYYYVGKTKHYLLIHCRGNQLLDYDKINKIIGAKFQRIDEKEESQNISYPLFGLVNPFRWYEKDEILQLFDNSLISQNFIPFTMMTNASHARWGIEFRPKELIEALPNTQINDVILEETKYKIQKHKIGILTGNSPESGILLWEKINEKIRECGGDKFLGDISFPELIIESHPEMGLSMELDLRFEEVQKTVKKGITNLCKRGATIVCIACNTTQYFSDELAKICKKYNSEYIRLSEITYQYLKKKNITSFDFLGINYVSDFKRWSDFKCLKRDFDLHLPNQRDIDKINKIAFDVKKNVKSPKSINYLMDVIHQATHTKHIVIALTELSILFKVLKNNKRKTKEKSNKNYIDTMDLLSEVIAYKYTIEYTYKINDTGIAKNFEE